MGETGEMDKTIYVANDNRFFLLKAKDRKMAMRIGEGACIYDYNHSNSILKQSKVETSRQTKITCVVF